MTPNVYLGRVKRGSMIRYSGHTIIPMQVEEVYVDVVVDEHGGYDKCSDTWVRLDSGDVIPYYHITEVIQ